MKTYILILLLFACGHLSATDYYISSGGNDANTGTSPAAAWRTITKVNSVFASRLPGDRFLFNRGDVFYGVLIVGRSGTPGNPITISAYGTGDDPVITGFTDVTAWTNTGGNIWQSTSAVSTVPYTNMVTINGVNTPMGNIGSLPFQTHTVISPGVDGRTKTITSSSLSGSPNWTGAEISFFMTTYQTARNVITSQTGSTLTIAAISTDVGIQADGQQFTIQNDIRTLNTQGEWYYSPATKKISVYSTSTPTNFKIASLDSLVYMNGRSYINIDHISFTGGNNVGVWMAATNHVRITNCSFDFMGRDGIFERNDAGAGYIYVENCLINHCNNDGINCYYANNTNDTIRLNNVKNCGKITFMGGNGRTLTGATTYSGIVNLGPNCLIELNNVDSCGYQGIQFYGSNSMIKNNYVLNTCQNLHDGGGIYTWNASTPTNQSTTPALTDRWVLNNIVGFVRFDNGIYMDDNSNGVHVEGNTVFNCNVGIYIHNNWRMGIYNNTCFDNTYAQLNVRNNNTSITMYNDTMKNNLFISKATSERAAYFYRLENINPGWQGTDSNYYARPALDNTVIDTYWSGVNALKTLTQYKTIEASPNSIDQHSKGSPKFAPVDSFLFIYNPTDHDSFFVFSYNYEDIKGYQYNGKDTLHAFQSRVLLQNGSVVGITSPTVNAGIDQLLPPSTATITASAISAPGHSITTYAWTQVSGPNTAGITSPSTASTGLTGLIDGVYIFRITVTQDDAQISTDDVQVTVSSVNIVPTADAGADEGIVLPTNTATLDGTGSTDIDGTIVTYGWSQISGPASSIVSASSATTVVNGLVVPGSYVYQLSVTDNNGATNTDTITVTVSGEVSTVPADIWIFRKGKYFKEVK